VLGAGATDVGRILTILDTTYKFFTVTGNSGSSTTVCQGTISGGTLSSTGAFANSALWISNNSTGSAGSNNYTVPLPRVVGNSYSYFPAGAISSGSVAGWYWTNWSAATVGQAYNNIYSSGQPAIVASPTAFSTTGPGAFTATSSTYLNSVTYSLPGNSMGKYGYINYYFAQSIPSNGNNKVATPNFGVTRLSLNNQQNVFGQQGMAAVINQGVTNGQATMNGNGNAWQSAAVPTFAANDTTTTQSVFWQQNLNSSPTDYNILEMYSAVLYPSF
jgi:hypothetical protein